jgi:hypothetical protein
MNLLLSLTCLPHLDRPGDIDLFQMRDLLTEDASDKKGFADIVSKRLQNDKVILFQQFFGESQQFLH